MPRYKVIIAYDGTRFHGFQKQPNERTVQEEIEKTLVRMNNGRSATVFDSGRTDADVYAIGQMIHSDYPQERLLEKMRFALNTQTPEDIAVRNVKRVSEDFHVRYHVIEKTYQSKVDIGKPRSPLQRFYVSYFPYSTDLEKIQQALPDLLGTHDFTFFCASGGPVEDRVRAIHEASVHVNEAGDELTFTFRGDDFLYKMIRILVGMLLKIGNGRLEPTAIPAIITAKDRNLAGPTTHPEGLYLVEVRYER